MNGNGNQVNLLKLGLKNSWNHIKWTYFWRVLPVWNHCASACSAFSSTCCCALDLVLSHTRCSSVRWNPFTTEKGTYILWQYGLSSFQVRDTKVDRFLAKKLEGNYCNLWIEAEPSKIRHHLRKVFQKVNSSKNVDSMKYAILVIFNEKKSESSRWFLTWKVRFWHFLTAQLCLFKK